MVYIHQLSLSNLIQYQNSNWIYERYSKKDYCKFIDTDYAMNLYAYEDFEL